MVRKAEVSDAPSVTELALLLWPDHDFTEMEGEFSGLLTNPEAAVFLVFQGESPIGFAQCQLRHDYVEGTDSSPVGYLEGIFVKASFRRQGYAKVLLAACEVWAKQRGCREFASDCGINNADSLRFHLNMGFQEAGRIICFTKTL